MRRLDYGLLSPSVNFKDWDLEKCKVACCDGGGGFKIWADGGVKKPLSVVGKKAISGVEFESDICTPPSTLQKIRIPCFKSFRGETLEERA
jgi:hypothetical protein